MEPVTHRRRPVTALDRATTSTPTRSSPSSSSSAWSAPASASSCSTTGARSPAGSCPPTRSSSRAATSAAARRASTRRGRSRTTASARSSPPASPTSSAPTARRSACCRCELPEEDVRARSRAGEAEVDLEALEVRFAGRAVPFEIDPEISHRLLNGLDDIAMRSSRTTRSPPTSASASGRVRSPPRCDRPRDPDALLALALLVTGCGLPGAGTTRARPPMGVHGRGEDPPRRADQHAGRWPVHLELRPPTRATTLRRRGGWALTRRRVHGIRCTAGARSPRPTTRRDPAGDASQVPVLWDKAKGGPSTTSPPTSFASQRPGASTGRPTYCPEPRRRRDRRAQRGIDGTVNNGVYSGLRRRRRWSTCRRSRRSSRRSTGSRAPRERRSPAGEPRDRGRLAPVTAAIRRRLRRPFQVQLAPAVDHRICGPSSESPTNTRASRRPCGMDEIKRHYYTTHAADQPDAADRPRSRPGLPRAARPPGARMSPRIVTLPGDGIGPEVMAAALEVLEHVAPVLTYEPAPVRRRAIDVHGVPLTGRSSWRRRAAPTRCCSPRSAGRSGTPPTPAPRARAGPARPAQGARAVRQPATCAPRARRSTTRARCSRELHRGHRPARGARAHRRHLLRRFGPRTATRRYDTCTYTVAEIERIARRGVPRRALAGDERGQGERPGVLAAVARGRPPRALRGIPERRARAPARRQRRDAAVAAPAPLRRHPHREPLRRHPQRRGRDAHGLHRHAAQRVARRRRAPGVFEPVHGSAPDIAGQEGQPARDVPVRRADAPPRARPGGRGDCRRIRGGPRARGGLRTADLGGSATTAEATQAVLAELVR